MTSCLLHRTYHEFAPECWQYHLTWMSERTRIPDKWRAEFYEQVVESAILGDTWEVRHEH